jgi:energy-coupling factor transporter ATP-binding protein EcfA2
MIPVCRGEDMEPIADIEAWSKKQSTWRQDCLRRLAISSGELSEDDLADLLVMIKAAAGFDMATPAPTATAFTKEHFGGGNHQPIVLKGIANVQNINRLTAKAGMDFCPKALTVIYGRNGSGKSGFVRILRTACRTRVETPAKLKVLGNVYGAVSGPQTADIIIDAGSGDMPIQWTSGLPASTQLMQVAVFDSLAAQLYVDGGSQIRFLPFGLALPHRLNSVCLSLKQKLEEEKAVVVGNKITLTAISFPQRRKTIAQTFDASINKNTTDGDIDAACLSDETHQKRLEEITNILAAGSAASTDLSVLVHWLERVKTECATAETGLGDSALEKLHQLQQAAVAAQLAAEVSASTLFTDDPLPGIGSASWRALWTAARDYSVTEAYPGRSFPVIVVDDGGDPACVLCQQPLSTAGADRMQRFQTYMEDVLGKASKEARSAVEKAMEEIPALAVFRSEDFADRLEQIRKRDEPLATILGKNRDAALLRREHAMASLQATASSEPPKFEPPHDGLNSLIEKLTGELAALSKAQNADEREILNAEKAELEDRKILGTNRETLVTRRDLMIANAAFDKALEEVQTRAITQKANELVETHLTQAVVTRFDAERERFDISHLKVGLSRKSGQTKAEFEIDPQTKLTKLTSEILSEGEQRALALAGFLTEVALTDGSGPIIIDDPVSSLDRDRGLKVARRLAEEATQRQVVVFTHDIIFFNELCREAEDQGIEPVTVALFSDKNAAGKIDAAGMVWKGLKVAKRIGRIKNDAAPLGKLYENSPTDYEIQLKNLYGRLRDTYERTVEEIIFREIVQRGSDAVMTQNLRYVTLSDDLALRFHHGMTRANTFSHDNPASDTVSVPTPNEFNADVAALEDLIRDLKAAGEAAEVARPQMKPKK